LSLSGTGNRKPPKSEAARVRGGGRSGWRRVAKQLRQTAHVPERRGRSLVLRSERTNEKKVRKNRSRVVPALSRAAGGRARAADEVVGDLGSDWWGGGKAFAVCGLPPTRRANDGELPTDLIRALLFTKPKGSQPRGAVASFTVGTRTGFHPTPGRGRPNSRSPTTTRGRK
jgi:hypothetical protein